MKKYYPKGVIPEEGVLRMHCEFSGAYLCVDVIFKKLQRGFVVIALLRCCSPIIIIIIIIVIVIIIIVVIINDLFQFGL